MLHPKSRRPSPKVQFHFYPVKEGTITHHSNNPTADTSDGRMRVSGATLDIARIAALTDPERAEVIEIKSREEFGKLRRAGR
jgi:hypothetical protein